MTTDVDCSQKVYQNRGNAPLLELITVPPGRLLDCGCGAGDNAAILTARGWSVTGITLSSAERELARPHCVEVHLANMEQGIPDAVGDGYDVAILSHVLEHLLHPNVVLTHLRRVLKPGGIIAVALPNVLGYRQRFQFLRGRFDYTNEGIMDATHVRFYTFKTGAKLLESNGYRVTTASAEGAMPLWKLKSVLPETTTRTINQWGVRHWPGLFGYQCLYIATPTG